MDDEPRSVNGPMVQVGWFAQGIWISMRDMATLRGTRIRAGAVPLYADAADARCFPAPDIARGETP